jgi:hypothetical protein
VTDNGQKCGLGCLSIKRVREREGSSSRDNEKSSTRVEKNKLQLRSSNTICVDKWADIMKSSGEKTMVPLNVKIIRKD